MGGSLGTGDDGDAGGPAGPGVAVTVGVGLGEDEDAELDGEVVGGLGDALGAGVVVVGAAVGTPVWLGGAVCVGGGTT